MESVSRQRLHQMAFPDRGRARGAIASAVNSRRLPSPQDLYCAFCGEAAEEYHHYLGYAPEQTFAVWPVCRECHRALPRDIRLTPPAPEGWLNMRQAAEATGYCITTTIQKEKNRYTKREPANPTRVVGQPRVGRAQPKTDKVAASPEVERTPGARRW